MLLLQNAAYKCNAERLIQIWQPPSTFPWLNFIKPVLICSFSNYITKLLEGILFGLLAKAGREIFELKNGKLFMRHPTAPSLSYIIFQKVCFECDLIVSDCKEL